MRKNLVHFGWLSILAAIATLLLKSYAYWLTDSVGLLSDALESLINLAAAMIVVFSLNLAARPPDESHSYGHEKIEYFSSGAEGILIIIAAVSIGLTAWERLWHPQSLQRIDLGLAISLLASLINLVVARILISVGKQYHSITLEADGRHLMTDVWTTVGIVAGIALIALAEHLSWLGEIGKQVGLKNWEILDPIIAIIVALHIIWSGLQLIRRTIAGLMDAALPAEERMEILAILDGFVVGNDIAFHALRTRASGSRRFMSVHVLVPGAWTIQQGHDLVEEIERKIIERFEHIDIDTHLEPIEDQLSWQHLK